jgi:hypothetical protein
MDKIVLAPIRGLDDQDLLIKFLYGAGLIERKKAAKKEPLILSVMKIFIKNKGKHISYDYLIKSLPKTKDKDLRSNIVKVCKKLADFGLIERTAYVPPGKKRWERAFRFISFSHAIELTKQKTELMLNTLEKIGDQLDEK